MSENFFDFTEAERNKISDFQRNRLIAYNDEVKQIKTEYKKKTGKQWDADGIPDKQKKDSRGNSDPVYMDAVVKILQAATREVADVGAYSVEIAKDHIKKNNLSAADVLEMAQEAANYYIAQIRAQIMSAGAETVTGYKDTDKISEDRLNKYKKSIHQQNGNIVVARGVAENALDEKMIFFYDLLTGTEELQILDDFIESSFNNCDFIEKSEDAGEKKESHRRKKFAARRSLPEVKKMGIMNDKINRQMVCDGGTRITYDDIGVFNKKTDGQIALEWAVNQAAKDAAESVPVYIDLTYKDDKGNTKVVALNAFDEVVYNTVGSIFHYWRQIEPVRGMLFSARDVFRAMHGIRGDDHAAPSKSMLQKIKRSLNKMRFTYADFDFSQELEKFDLYFEDERLTEGKFKALRLLDVDEVEFKTENGRTINGYRAEKTPVFYEYNRAKGHIKEIPANVFNIQLNSGDYVEEFKYYLALRVQLLKDRELNNPTILLSTIYKDNNIPTPEMRADEKTFKNDKSRQAVIRRTRKQDREKIETILTTWVNMKWIEGFTPVKEKSSVTGYKIDLFNLSDILRAWDKKEKILEYKANRDKKKVTSFTVTIDKRKRTDIEKEFASWADRGDIENFEQETADADTVTYKINVSGDTAAKKKSNVKSGTL